MNKYFKIVAIPALICVMSAAFFTVSTIRSDKKTEDIPIEKTKTVSVKNINPLTGLEMDKSKLRDRPIAVMINNFHKGQPLHGISHADIAYECLIEGGITRIVGIFKDISGVNSVGTVRSARPYFINLAKSHDAIYFHLGGSTIAYEILKTDYIDSVNFITNEQYMWRDAERRKNLGLEHSALSSGELILKAVSDKKFRRTLADNYTYTQKFGDDSQVLSGSNANKLTVKFSGYKSTVFDYDAESKSYLISQFGKPQFDALENKQNSKPNIIIIQTDINNIGQTELVEMKLVGSGTGKYMSNGKIIDLTWSRNNDGEPIKYFTTDGKPLVMSPGKIYVCVISKTAAITVE